MRAHTTAPAITHTPLYAQTHTCTYLLTLAHIHTPLHTHGLHTFTHTHLYTPPTHPCTRTHTDGRIQRGGSGSDPTWGLVSESLKQEEMKVQQEPALLALHRQ
ncbi:hypothetical protein Y1Q_0009714 [Alligator mississippiensis]|uniref:Uncharacterized protein n=1 Tax=Alligator mississippiensis TaxID=8496 RepID=A0A151MWI6_ALLMI|nr:hypothetical protein Y1Q_0009714 [Alligator mississippiensis]